MSGRNVKRLLLAIVAATIVYILQDGIHFVDETQQLVVTQFGAPVGRPVTTSGLFFDLPLLQTENAFDKRLIEYKSSATSVPTRDKRYITVSAYAIWHVTDPLKFFERVQNEAGATARLDEIVAGEVRNAVARYDLLELVRTTNRTQADVGTGVPSEEQSLILEKLEKGRAGLAAEVLARARARSGELGFEVVDVRFSQMNYVPEVQQAVYARMIAERQRVAAQYRSEGQGEAARISGERDRDMAQIRSEAYRTAEERRGKGDGEATRIYADAYGRDPEFYAFVKSLDTYEKSFDPKTLLILDGNNELLKYLGKTR
jgi:membrane protease subunit HflC